jgi:hypothetical protein
MSVSTADKVFLCIGLIYFASAVSWIGIALYLAYTKMDLMLRHMKNSPAVVIRVFLIRTGIWGRMHVFGLIMGLMVMPGMSIRKGVVSAEDLKNFPADLKRKLVAMYWVCGGLLLIMCGLAAYAKFGRV